MSPDQRTRALRLADGLSSPMGEPGVTGWATMLDGANLMRELAAEPVRVPMTWQPIETAPRDAMTYFLATNGSGVWVAHWNPVATSGYRFEKPWRSAMLNHWHIKDEALRHGPPTHWMPLPDAPHGITLDAK